MADLVAVFAILAAAWLMLAAAVGVLAQRRGRSAVRWAFAAALVSAPVAAAILLALHSAGRDATATVEPPVKAIRLEPTFADDLEAEDWERPPVPIGEAVQEERPRPPKAVVEPPNQPPYRHGLPRYIAFVDVETTGFGDGHRIVSFACILLSTASLAWGRFDTHVAYCLFNPGRPCDPGARRVHGYTDRFLAAQEGFAERVDAYDLLLSSAELVVAHNIQFDLGMIDRELALLGRPRVWAQRYCTMQQFRTLGGSGSAKLDAVAAGIGLSRAGATHGALEDAWLAMMIYLHQQGCPYRIALSDLGDAEPVNVRLEEARPQPSRRRADETA